SSTWICSGVLARIKHLSSSGPLGSYPLVIRWRRLGRMRFGRIIERHPVVVSIVLPKKGEAAKHAPPAPLVRTKYHIHLPFADAPAFLDRLSHFKHDPFIEVEDRVSAKHAEYANPFLVDVGHADLPDATNFQTWKSRT